MVNRTALAHNLNTSRRAKTKQGKMVYGYAALNEMGKQTSANIESGIEDAKEEMESATSKKQYNLAKTKLVVGRIAQGLMLAPFAFFVWLFVDTIII